MPLFTRNEKLVLRATDRKELFAEKFASASSASSNVNARRTSGVVDATDGQIGVIDGAGDGTGANQHDPLAQVRDRSASDVYGGSERPISPRSERSASVSSEHSSLVEAIPWGDPDLDLSDNTAGPPKGLDTEDDGFTLVDTSMRAPSRSGHQVSQSQSHSQSQQATGQGQPSSAQAFDQQSRSSKATRSTRHKRHGSTNTMAPSSSSDPDFAIFSSSNSNHGVNGATKRRGGESDTHFYPTSLVWNKADENTGIESVVAKIDVMIPTCSFPEEVGDVRFSIHLCAKPRGVCLI